MSSNTNITGDGREEFKSLRENLASIRSIFLSDQLTEDTGPPSVSITIRPAPELIPEKLPSPPPYPKIILTDPKTKTSTPPPAGSPVRATHILLPESSNESVAPEKHTSPTPPGGKPPRHNVIPTGKRRDSISSTASSMTVTPPSCPGSPERDTTYHTDPKSAFVFIHSKQQTVEKLTSLEQYLNKHEIPFQYRNSGDGGFTGYYIILNKDEYESEKYEKFREALIDYLKQYGIFKDVVLHLNLHNTKIDALEVEIKPEYANYCPREKHIEGHFSPERTTLYC